MEGKTALLAGATGLIGKSCLNYLLEDNYYKRVIILTRRPIGLRNPKLKELFVDFERLDEYKNDMIADHIFCCLGTTMKKAGSKEKFRKVDLEYPYTIAKIGLENGAYQFNIITALGADSGSGIFYNKTKGEVEELIKKLNYQSVNIFRPSILEGDRKENRPAEKTGVKMMKALSFLFVGGLAKYKPIEADTVARAIVTIAKKETTGVNIFESDKIKEIA